jgi:hypothetical protein
MIKSQRRLMKMVESGTARRKGAVQRALRMAQTLSPAIQGLGQQMAQGFGQSGGNTPAISGSGSYVAVPQQPGSSNIYVNPTGLGTSVLAENFQYSPTEMMRLLKAFTSTRFPRKTMPDGSLRDQHPEFIALPFPPALFEPADQDVWGNGERLGIAYVLPDGSELVPDGKGGCQQVASDGTITYRPCYIRNFNRFLNASDLVDEFIRALGAAGMKQDQVLKVPLGPFIHWLIGKAAEADGDPVPADIPPVNNHPALAPFRLAPKCKLCGKFLPRRLAAGGMFFCNGRHMDRYVREQGIGA